MKTVRLLLLIGLLTGCIAVQPSPPNRSPTTNLPPHLHRLHRVVLSSNQPAIFNRSTTQC